MKAGTTGAQDRTADQQETDRTGLSYEQRGKGGKERKPKTEKAAAATFRFDTERVDVWITDIEAMKNEARIRIQASVKKASKAQSRSGLTDPELCFILIPTGKRELPEMK